ncbi:MAG: hypothetical protein KatS3mg105_3078 [Gemmatales bacterium]|nr:MAG: hypothetical protein KatS3mg105_3078 [Gemmatales bacterium]
MRLPNVRPSVWLLGFCCLVSTLPGCASFWDEITRRDKSFREKVATIFRRTDPLLVLQQSNDGDERYKAILALREPADEQQREQMFKMLAQTAVSDRQPLCRLAAIRRLGEFEGPRASRALEEAFYKAADFEPDVATRLQVASLEAMGKTKSPEALAFLVKQLREPPAERSDLAQQRNDRCVAAARALENFPNTQAVEALYEVVKNEKEDVALRARAHQSLQAATGKNLPFDPQAWDQFLHPQPGAVVQESSGWFNLASWFRRN